MGFVRQAHAGMGAMFKRKFMEDHPINEFSKCDVPESHDHLPDILKKGWEAIYYCCHPL